MSLGGAPESRNSVPELFSVLAPSASASFSDLHGSSALVAAVQWLEETLLGTIASTVAIVAVASVGMMMLSGRIEWRRSATVLCGCFIVFGASRIAAGIQSAVTDREEVAPEPFEPIQPPPSFQRQPVAPPARPTPTYDPYAGASVPG